MQHLESAASPIARPASARWMRVLAAVVLCLAGPAVSLAGVLTTGLRAAPPRRSGSRLATG
jgi:hypothetical protein